MDSIPDTPHAEAHDVSDYGGKVANIAYARSERALLDEGILGARKHLGEVEHRRDVLRRLAYMERGLVSPIGKLPSEILQYILLLANEGVTISDNHFYGFPLLAAQVCSYWRSIIYSCAHMWADVHFELLKPAYHYNALYVNLLQDCLKLSYPIPLSLKFGKRITPIVLGDRCLQALQKCAPRWKDVVIAERTLTKAVFSSMPKDLTFEHLETLEFLNLTYPVSIATAPKLRRLTISRFSIPGNRKFNVRIVITSAPRLRELDLQRFRCPLTALTGFDWSKITKFEANRIRNQPEDLLATILEHMSNLVSLTIFGQTFSNRIVSMPHLEELTTGDWRLSETCVFNNITAPCLKRLVVDGRTDFSSLPTFVNRSQCKIEEIKLNGAWIDVSWGIAALASVKTLTWNKPDAVCECFGPLTYGLTLSTSGTFTGLEHLLMTGVNGVPDSDNVNWSITEFIDMLKSRLRPQPTNDSTRTYLKSVKIEFLALADQFFEPLRDFVNSELVKSSGVRVDISIGGGFHLTTSA